MSNRPLLISLVVVLATGAGVFLSEHQDVVPSPVLSVPVVGATSTESVPRAAPAAAPTPKTATSSVVIAPKDAATLKLPTQSYVIGVGEKETVLEMMTELEKNGSITFTSHDYPSLGKFIDSINGEENGNGKYWVYYVNGVDASKGVSTQVVRVGDVIEWKYENSY